MIHKVLLVAAAVVPIAGASAADPRTASPDSGAAAKACSQPTTSFEGVIGPFKLERSGPEVWTLHKAAMVFARSGQVEACRRVVEGIRQYIASIPTNAPPPAGTVDQRIGNARPLSQVQGVVRVSELMGTPVISSRGETLGDVDDVVLAPTGAAYLLVGTGGFMDVGEAYVPVEANAVRVLDEDTLAVALDRARFEDAPQFSREAIEGDAAHWMHAATAWWEDALARN